MDNNDPEWFCTKPEYEGNNKISCTVLKWNKGPTRTPFTFPIGHPLCEQKEGEVYEGIWPPAEATNILYKMFCWDHDCSTPYESLNFTVQRDSEGAIKGIWYSNENQEQGGIVYTEAEILMGFWDDAEYEVAKWVCEWSGKDWDRQDESYMKYLEKNPDPKRRPFEMNGGYDHFKINGWYAHDVGEYAIEEVMRRGVYKPEHIDWDFHQKFTGMSDNDIEWMKGEVQKWAKTEHARNRLRFGATSHRYEKRIPNAQGTGSRPSAELP